MRESRKAHYEEVREANKSLLLRSLAETPASRVDLARRTGLSPATVTSLVKDLLQQGLVKETEQLASLGGRPAVLLEFNPQARKAVGVVISKRRVQAALVNLAGQPLRATEQPLADAQPETALRTVAALVEQLVAEAGVPPERVAGIGVGVPGIVDSQRGVIHLSTVLEWREVPLGAALTARLSWPVIVQRNGNAAALAEAVLGQGQSQANLLYVHLGDGIGAGVIMGGQIYPGVSGRAGEIGHNVVDPRGPLCRCGNRGCLEAVASGVAIAQQAEQLADSGMSPYLARVKQERGIPLTAREVAEAATQGDAAALALLEQVGNYIGLAIAGLVNMLDIPTVVLGGGLVQAGQPLLDPISQRARAAALPFGDVQLQIQPSQLWPRAGVLGAASLIIQQLLQQGGESLT